MARLVGAVLDGRYQILSLIGEGGMGAVYRARQATGGPDVAIKVLHDELIDQPDQRERFEREARALFGLEHPNLLHVMDFGIHERMPYLVMELLEGQPLDDLVGETGVAFEDAMDLALQVLRGLALAHQNGVLHRDLKTENVFVARGAHGPVCKLLDFGLVKFVDDDRWGSSKKLTMQGAVFGTPAYMAPEQCAGAPVDARGDVYSMGVILFELFTGTWPFVEETRMAMYQAHLTRKPPRLSEAAEGKTFPEELERLVARALEKQAKDRFQNAGEMLAALEAVPRNEPRPMPARPVELSSEPARAAFPVALVAGVALLIFVLLALAALFLFL